MYDVYGVICGSYEEACEVAGVDTPAQIAAEIAADAQAYFIEHQDAMEACGGPIALHVDPETGIVDIAPMNWGVNSPDFLYQDPF